MVIGVGSSQHKRMSWESNGVLRRASGLYPALQDAIGSFESSLFRYPSSRLAALECCRGSKRLFQLTASIEIGDPNLFHPLALGMDSVDLSARLLFQSPLVFFMPVIVFGPLKFDTSCSHLISG